MVNNSTIEYQQDEQPLLTSNQWNKKDHNLLEISLDLLLEVHDLN